MAATPYLGQGLQQLGMDTIEGSVAQNNENITFFQLRTELLNDQVR